MLPFGYGNDFDLNGSKPERKCPGVVFNKQGHKTFNTSINNPVDHRRAIFFHPGQYNSNQIFPASENQAGLFRTARSFQGNPAGENRSWGHKSPVSLIDCIRDSS